MSEIDDLSLRISNLEMWAQELGYCRRHGPSGGYADLLNNLRDIARDMEHRERQRDRTYLLMLGEILKTARGEGYDIHELAESAAAVVDAQAPHCQDEEEESDD